jgi:hypothetical protein
MTVVGNAVQAELMSERKYDVMSQNGCCSGQGSVRKLWRKTEYRSDVFRATQGAQVAVASKTS